MTTDTTPRSPLFKQLAEITATQSKILHTLGRIESRQSESIVLDKGITIERDEDGECWLQVGQHGAEISAQEYEQLSLWAVCEQPNQPPAVVHELGKVDLWRKEFDAETERLRREGFGRWAESLADDQH